MDYNDNKLSSGNKTRLNDVLSAIENKKDEYTVRELAKCKQVLNFV